MQTGSYINGKWFHPNSERLVRNVNPADPKDVIAEFPAATAQDVRAAIDAATAAFPLWKNTPGPERGRVLWRAVNLARARLEDIARTMTREEGKILKEARGETLKGISLLEFFAGEGYRMHGKTMPSEVRDTFTYTIRRPLGVVGLITPWNFPWALPVWKIAPALVAGNTIVFKPAELTPATASLLVEIFEEAGLPPGVLNMVVGSGSVVGNAIVDAPETRAISFTGSNQVGNALYQQAAKLNKKVTCEMGGKNAIVILPDADLDKAVNAIIGGAFGSTGQRCTATSRVLAAPQVKQTLLERLTERASKLKVGPGLDESSEMGPAVDEKQWKTDLSYIEIARGEGAQLVVGGNVPENSNGGYFVQPTIFDGVKPHMRIFQEEVFGPVLAVGVAQDLQEAIHFSNAVEFGLTTSIFTQDINNVLRYVEDVETGMVHVNEPTIGGEAQLPFGGSKNTGVGEREMAEEGLNFFTELKTVFINYGGTGERSMIR
ncbi:MAG: Aldehyde dehydrogenase, thermostable [Anaerolineae bacterium]|nr:Aldehyde dehydrogenase, thermostable [Anaerolineae bacterium]MDL1895312.1 aldehyde dehydrogenase family protein [Anaerolineae bacterium CFX7]RIK33448.1 MAG: aldehyde dehydrogenase family protein [Chloroflexota bacterium]